MSSSKYLNAPTFNKIDAANYARFGKCWWDDSGIMRTLHNQNRIRVPWTVETLTELGIAKSGGEKSLEGLLILDAGCGGGFLTEALAGFGCTIVGLDVCPEILDVAKQHAALDSSLTNITYVYESIEEHVKANYEKYDAVLLYEVIDHVNEPELFLESCVKCLKPGGLIFLATFNKTWSSWFLGIIFAQYIWGFIPRGAHCWDKFIDPKDLEKMLEKLKCKVQSVRGMLYNPLTEEWIWTGTQAVHYAMCALKDE